MKARGLAHLELESVAVSRSKEIEAVANENHLEILRQGVGPWNKWREENENVRPDLKDADLYRADLSDANLSGADLSGAKLLYAKLNGANLSRADLSRADLFNADLIVTDLSSAILCDATLNGANLSNANLSKARLHDAKLYHANLSSANLSYAKLRGAFLCDADLQEANLTGADLTGADLSCADLVETNLTDATITGCRVYGASAWNVTLMGATQHDLIISKQWEAVVTVDNLEVAQFIYLLLNNEKIRDVIDTVGKKGVLILGRFTPERKAVLDALRVELRRLGYVPMLFDFVKPADKDITETIMTLAGLSCFIIADITNPKSSPLELQATVPNYMIPFVPIIQDGEEPFSMFKDLRGKFSWVLDPLTYDSISNLIKGLERAVVIPALKRRDELMRRKAEELPARHIGDYLKDS